jgi:IPT/TIG domain/PASTA domain
VRWHATGLAGGPFRLRVLSPAGGTLFTGAQTSAPVTPTGPETQVFATDLPITVGQTIGIDNTNPGDKLGAFAAPGGGFALLSPPLQEGVTRSATPGFAGGELALDAEVQPLPTITGVGPASGPISGGTPVTITGTNFEGTTAVSFGSTPAAGFIADSEGQITATAPAGAAGGVPVSVTTLAGTATSSQQFTYQTPPAPIVPAPTCTVPRLKGRSLKASKKRIKAADCKIGKVTKKKGAKVATGKVVGQSRKPGTVLAAGTVVNVTLGKG